jgi:hypothetical protein
MRAAASVRIQPNTGQSSVPVEKAIADRLLVQTTHKMIAVGASTGGTRAIEAVHPINLRILCAPVLPFVLHSQLFGGRQFFCDPGGPFFPV